MRGVSATLPLKPSKDIAITALFDFLELHIFKASGMIPSLAPLVAIAKRNNYSMMVMVRKILSKPTP